MDERAMIGRRPHPVQPRAAVFVAWRGKRAPGQLLGVQPERGALRRIEALRQRAAPALAGFDYGRTFAFDVVVVGHGNSPCIACYCCETNEPLRARFRKELNDENERLFGFSSAVGVDRVQSIGAEATRLE